MRNSNTSSKANSKGKGSSNSAAADSGSRRAHLCTARTGRLRPLREHRRTACGLHRFLPPRLLAAGGAARQLAEEAVGGQAARQGAAGPLRRGRRLRWLSRRAAGLRRARLLRLLAAAGPLPGHLPQPHRDGPAGQGRAGAAAPGLACAGAGDRGAKGAGQQAGRGEHRGGRLRLLAVDAAAAARGARADAPGLLRGCHLHLLLRRCQWQEEEEE
mmetsp:Transcript_79937/g.258933  ORF Transcript_79937/g.258933 Transcript_79937/m.258933 type:complete len:215 (-) Transcript_79937:557-1201(-)